MNDSQQSLWQELQTKGLVSGELAAPVMPESPWYVRLLVGFSGWLAAGFMLGFFIAGFEFVFENPGVAIVLGAAMIGLAYKILQGVTESDFKNQFALAISFSGQGLGAFGIFYHLDSLQGFSWTIAAVVQAGLAWYMPNSLHRLCSTVIASISICIALAFGHFYFIQVGLLMAAVAFVWLRELDWLELHGKIKPIAYGLTLALIYQGNSSQVTKEMMDVLLSDNLTKGMLDSPWLGELLMGLVMLGTVWTLLKQQQKTQSLQITGAVMVVTLLLVLVSLEAHGISIGIMILLLGYANGNRMLTGLGIVSLLFDISAYYYRLDVSLLEKSKLLALMGLLLMAVRVVIHVWQSRIREAGHA